MDRLLSYIGHRWKWIVLGAAVGALLGFATTLLRSDAWVADSLVVLTDARIPPEEFSDVATAIFPTDSVLGPVVEDLGIEQTPRSLISSGALQIQSAPGGLAVRVVARTQDQLLSTRMANAAAASLAEVGQANGLGEMAQFPVEEARREADPVVRSVAVGMLAGAAIVLLAFAIWFLLKERPRHDEDRLGADVTLRLRAAPADDPEADGAVSMTPPDALAGLWRGFIAETTAHPVTGLTLEDGPNGWAVLAVADDLDRIAEGDGSAATVAWSSASEPLPAAVSQRVVVVAPGGSGSRLDDLRREVRAIAPDALIALVVVSAADLS